MRYTASNVSSASHDLHKEHTCLNRGQSHASKRFFVSPDALAPDGDETTVICRSAPITDYTWPPELATAGLWKPAFKPSEASSVSPRRCPFLARNFAENNHRCVRPTGAPTVHFTAIFLAGSTLAGKQQSRLKPGATMRSIA